MSTKNLADLYIKLVQSKLRLLNVNFFSEMDTDGTGEYKLPCKAHLVCVYSNIAFKVQKLFPVSVSPFIHSVFDRDGVVVPI